LVKNNKGYGFLRGGSVAKAGKFLRFFPTAKHLPVKKRIGDSAEKAGADDF